VVAVVTVAAGLLGIVFLLLYLDAVNSFDYIVGSYNCPHYTSLLYIVLGIILYMDVGGGGGSLWYY
jgi:hypothetical protein